MAAGGGGSFLIRKQLFEKLVPQRVKKKRKKKEIKKRHVSVWDDVFDTTARDRHQQAGNTDGDE